MYLLEDHMDDYKISLSDDEKKAIKDAAKEFSKDNDKDDKEKVSGDTRVCRALSDTGYDQAEDDGCHRSRGRYERNR